MKKKSLLAIVIIAVCALTTNCTKNDLMEEVENFDNYVEIAKGHSDYVQDFFCNSQTRNQSNDELQARVNLKQHFLNSTDISQELKTDSFYNNLINSNVELHKESIKRYNPHLVDAIKEVTERNCSFEDAKKSFENAAKKCNADSNVLLLSAIAFDSYTYWATSKFTTRSAQPDVDIDLYNLVLADVAGGAESIYSKAFLLLITGASGGIAAAEILAGAGVASINEALNQYYNSNVK